MGLSIPIERKQKVVELLQSDRSYTHIARLSGVSLTTVKRIAKDLGINRARREYKRAKYHREVVVFSDKTNFRYENAKAKVVNDGIDIRGRHFHAFFFKNEVIGYAETEEETENDVQNEGREE